MNHGKPIATLEYSGVERFQNSRIYQIYFTSDVAILDLFKSRIGQGLVCALEDDVNFSMAHPIYRSGVGSVELAGNTVGEGYRSEVMFSESAEGKGGEFILGGNDLSRLLMKRDYISCVFRVHTTSYKTYFSTVMRVPTADLLKAMNKK
nr:hypothetical protein [Pseudomonas sp. CVAP\